MKKLIYFIPMALLFAACGGTTGGGANLPMTSQNDSTSYAFGILIADNLNQIKEDVGAEHALNLDHFTNGVREAVGGDAKMTKEEADVVWRAFGQMAQAASQKKKQSEDMKNIAIGEKFLAENKAKEGVQVTASGLQYKVIQAGSGANPKAEEKVRVIYTGKLIDGTVFDTSIKTGKPAEFFLNQVIPGWTEGVQLMKPGSKYEFYIPSNLAYGPRGSQDRIPGNSALIFEIEYLGLAE